MQPDGDSKPVMDLRTIAERLTSIQNARTTAMGEVGNAVQRLYGAYLSYDSAHRMAMELNDAGALAGSQAEELRELCAYLHLARNILAESGFVVSELGASKTHFLQVLETMGAAAREGMQGKLLATWEVQALREVAVRALAGNP